LLSSIQTVYDESTIGQTGVNITSRFGEPLTYARHLLWDIKDGRTFYSEFDVHMNGSFVTNNVPEIWLTGYGLAPTESTALEDSDNDGLCNWEEYYAGTSPVDQASVFTITANSLNGGEHILHWNAVAGKSYAIEFKADLKDALWTELERGIPGVEPQCTRSVLITGEKGFIRIKVE
jgi:hypothetical protein